MHPEIQELCKRTELASMLNMLKTSDSEAYEHCLLTADFLYEFLKPLPDDEFDATKEEILIGALLHDIGKAFIPFSIQKSTEILTPYREEIIHIHPTLGKVLVGDGFTKPVSDIILMHHANYDGTGYPTIGGIKFDASNVPEYVWIVAYADRFIAMTTKRPFRNPLSYDKAWKELLIQSKQGLLPYKFITEIKRTIAERSLVNIEEENEYNEILPRESNT